jgi:hypothetical protein
MKFFISAVSATLLVTAICSPIIIAKGWSSICSCFINHTDYHIIDNAAGLEKKTAEVAYDYGEYSVEAKREAEKAYDYGEYSVEAKRVPEAEKAYDYGEYSVEGKRAPEAEKAYDYGEYSVEA